MLTIQQLHDAACVQVAKLEQLVQLAVSQEEQLVQECVDANPVRRDEADTLNGSKVWHRRDLVEEQLTAARIIRDSLASVLFEVTPDTWSEEQLVVVAPIETETFGSPIHAALGGGESGYQITRRKNLEKFAKSSIDRPHPARYEVGDRVERLDIDDDTVHEVLEVSETPLFDPKFPLQTVRLSGYPNQWLSTHRLCIAA